MDAEMVAQYAINLLLEHYPATVMERFAFTSLPEEASEVLQTAGKKMGCLKTGGEVDSNRTAESILREIRSGKFGKITYELPENQQIES
jgi:ribosome biogenesis GTPase A